MSPRDQAEVARKRSVQNGDQRESIEHAKELIERKRGWTEIKRSNTPPPGLRVGGQVRENKEQEAG